MTETPNTPTEPDTTTPDTPTTDTDTAVVPDKDTGPTGEARKYRKRAQEAETERDALRERITTLQRTEVERLAAQHLAAGADIWHTSNDLAALLDDDGNIDHHKITERVDAILTERPHWRKPAPATESSSTVRGNDRIGHNDQPTFADAFKPRNQR